MIEQKIIDQLSNVGSHINTIHKIILFGSRAVGDHTLKSDIDLAFVAPNMTKEEWVELTFTLEEDLDTLLFLDLIKYEDAPEDLKKEIMKSGRVLYSKGAVLDREST
ncbi:nucleotidyltransferase domain-containing protein [Oceanobacillus jeddahense]|uniref:Nucleotidyltransferase domain-containing protein n=1 Tax=Oceanobacillus jeddahense TaxID=1462527 RepID=A0ABY5JXC2_9BACI|nr:nucleotidyltransferase domain-containing protein [Oceanobacillus jeddahense]UUI04890.1 nucleotidyltransferase domain-containing protein [Oceanobacillus jeddahense]